MMFSCCWRTVRSTEDTADNDCRWKTGEKTRAYSRASHSGSISGPTPVFYIDSGYSTNTDSNADAVMTSAKLDPNSQLQKKSKLHNEKLPSFSALDRTKRPRIRREEAVVEEDSCGLAYEPLTFETFRSSSPPLAVIAPLANSKAHLQNGYQSKNFHHTNDAERHRDKKAKSRTNLGELEDTDFSQDSQPLPKLTHQMSISKDGAVTFQRKGLINEGYCPDSDSVVWNKPNLSGQQSSRTSRHSVPQIPGRPTSLHLPNPDNHSPSSFTSSDSVFPGESDCAESALESDTLSQTDNKRVSVDGKDLRLFQTETSASSSLQVPGSSPQHQLRVLGESNGVARNVKYSTDDKASVANCDKRTVLESIPETPSMVKKVPPKKPKRKNPPSNVSSAASREAIITCLTSKEEQNVSSSDLKRHSDVELRHGGDDHVFQMDDVVLMPPEPFMDHDYAGFDSFDEVNGSLV